MRTTPLLTVAEVADYLRVSEMTIYRMITAGDLVATRVGRRWRVHPDDLAAFLDGARVVAKAS